MMATREFTEYEEELEDDVLPSHRRQGGGVRVKLRGGLPRSRSGKIAIAAGALVFVGLCGALAYAVRTAILHDERFMIASSSSIETVGNSHVTRRQLVSLFGEDIERNIFRVPLEDRRSQIENLPWVQRATVMRLLPNHLRISVDERTPVAFVRQGNRIGLVDANGVLLGISADAQLKTHYSFPVVTGLTESDPLSMRAARMKLYSRFTGELDGSGQKISEKLSEVDLSNPEDVRAVVQDKGGEVMVHFGEEEFLDRYKKFEEHLGEWRQQYPHLASVDMRYDRQVVLEMQPGTAAPVVGEQTAAPADGSDKPSTVAKPATVAAAPAQVIPTPASHAAVVKKPVAKAVAKGRKPAPKKSAPAKGGAAETRPAAAAPAQAVRVGESFWVHPKKVTAESQSTHPPQVVHP